MRIKKSKETLILTQKEKAILSKAYEILDEIYEECESDGDIEAFADEAKENIKYLLEDAEVEGGRPSEGIKVTITI